MKGLPDPFFTATEGSYGRGRICISNSLPEMRFLPSKSCIEAFSLLSLDRSNSTLGHIMALPKAPSLSQLVANVRANVRRIRLEQNQTRQRIIDTGADPPPPYPYSPSLILKMTSDAKLPAIEYTSRTLDQEIDTVAICPLHNEYMVIGTYSLVKKDTPTEYHGQVRRGSLRVMTVSTTFKPSYAGGLPPVLDNVDLPCAVLDIDFHPQDPTLLGVATSNAHMRFFRLIIHGDVLGRRVVTKLLPLGNVRVSDNDEHGLTPLVTQFFWFKELSVKGIKGLDDLLVVAFAATTSFGETRVIKVHIPAIRDTFDERIHMDGVKTISSSEIVHKHDLEAWTVASINFHNTADDEKNNGGGQRLVLSGGDDSALVASVMVPATPEWPPFGTERSKINITPWWKDKRNHNAGVVAILPLTPPPIAPNTTLKPRNVPILTGSYDEYLRIFEIDPKIFRPTFRTELKLGGGVWRLKVLDEYTTTTTNPKEEDQTGKQYHYLLLASLMHAGASILRITFAQPPFPPSSSAIPLGIWTITPLVTFTTGHESMVYACDARLENPLEYLDESLEESNDKDVKDAEREFERKGYGEKMREPPRYTIVSTSFYDMKICTWTFVDEFKVQE